LLTVVGLNSFPLKMWLINSGVPLTSTDYAVHVFAGAWLTPCTN